MGCERAVWQNGRRQKMRPIDRVKTKAFPSLSVVEALKRLKNTKNKKYLNIHKKK